MKFLGIDCEIIGNDDIIFYILKKISILEKRYKLYINPSYLEKFYFVIGLHHQIVDIDYNEIKSKDVYDKDNPKIVTNLSVNIYGINDISKEQLYDQFVNSFEELQKKDISIDEFIDTIISENTFVSDDNNESRVLSSGIYEFKYFNDIEDDYLSQNYNDNSEETENVDEYENIDKADSKDYNKDDSKDENLDEGENKEYTSENEEEDDIDEYSDQFTTSLYDFNCYLKTPKSIKISLFVKETSYDPVTSHIKYSIDKLKYLNSFIINDNESIKRKCYNYKNLLSKNKSEIKDNLEIDADEKYKSFSDKSYLDSYFETSNINEIYFQQSLLAIKTGYYFNFDDILFHYTLNNTINSYKINDYVIKILPHSIFKKSRYTSVYKNNIKSNKLDSIYSSLKNTLECDMCFKNISKKELFYSSADGGDICKNCYELKLSLFKKRISYLKKKILFIGKQELFKKEKIKTIEWLKNNKIKKLSQNKKNEFIKKAFKQIKISNPNKICRICFSELDFNFSSNESNVESNILFELNNGNTDISVGCLCGHCFHSSCLEGLSKIECPYCRISTKFTRLFL